MPINNLDANTDSKYNNVDKDWIDVKSNNYFSNEEFQDNYPSSKVGLNLTLRKQLYSAKQLFKGFVDIEIKIARAWRQRRRRIGGRR